MLVLRVTLSLAFLALLLSRRLWLMSWLELWTWS